MVGSILVLTRQCVCYILWVDTTKEKKQKTTSQYRSRGRTEQGKHHLLDPPVVGERFLCRERVQALIEEILDTTPLLQQVLLLLVPIVFLGPACR